MKIDWEIIKYHLRFGLSNLWFNYVQNPLKERRKRNFIKKVVEYQFKLAKVNLSYEELLEYQKTDKSWFDRWTITEQQQIKVYKYAKKLLKQIYPNVKESKLDSEVAMYILDWGLKLKKDGNGHN